MKLFRHEGKVLRFKAKFANPKPEDAGNAGGDLGLLGVQDQVPHAQSAYPSDPRACRKSPLIFLLRSSRDQEVCSWGL